MVITCVEGVWCAKRLFVVVLFLLCVGCREIHYCVMCFSFLLCEFGRSFVSLSLRGKKTSPFKLSLSRVLSFTPLYSQPNTFSFFLTSPSHLHFLGYYTSTKLLTLRSFSQCGEHLYFGMGSYFQVKALVVL